MIEQTADKKPELRGVCTNALCTLDGILHIHLSGRIDDDAIIITGLCNWVRSHPLFQERR